MDTGCECPCCDEKHARTCVWTITNITDSLRMSFITSGFSDFVRSMVKDDFHSSDSDSENSQENHLSGNHGNVSHAASLGRGVEAHAGLSDEGDQQQRYFNGKLINSGVIG